MPGLSRLIAMDALGCSRREAVLRVRSHPIYIAKSMGKWNDRWVDHPFPDMSEPDKAISHLTDFGDYDLDHLAWLYNKASLHAVDTMFMQIRRRVMMLERGIHSQGNRGRVWHGYAPYNPKQIVKMLMVFRAVHNFVIEGEDKKTPAMRLGLARGPVRYEDILYFM